MHSDDAAVSKAQASARMRRDTPASAAHRCSCRLVGLTMPAGAAFEVRACRIQALLAPGLDQRQMGARCVVMLTDGSAIACVETSEQLVESGAWMTCGRTGEEIMRSSVEPRCGCATIAEEQDGGAARLVERRDLGEQHAGPHRPEVAGSIPAPAIATRSNESARGEILRYLKRRRGA